MVNEEILGGLKSALDRGESLKRAMMTLYNSGYKKEEIEECARMLVENRENQIQVPNFPIQQIQEVKPQFQQPVTQKPAPQIKKINQPIQTVRSYPVYSPVQTISNYMGGNTKREIAIIFILVFLLIFLIISLGLIFLFKQQLINFFGNIFGQ
jgi:hypothetical protein